MQLNLILPHVSEGLIPHDLADDMLKVFSNFIDIKLPTVEGTLTYKLNKLKDLRKLGISMKEWDQSSLMQKFQEKIRIIISHKYGVTLENFPITAVRVSLKTLEFTKLPWHQDEATWQTSKECRENYPFTAWVPLMSPRSYDGIEIFNVPYSKLHWHKQVDKVGYFGGEGFQEISKHVEIMRASVKKGDATIFSSLAPHRSYSENNDVNEARVSMDFRFVPKNSISVTVSSRHWKYLVKNLI
jgi:hypothetical protein